LEDAENNLEEMICEGAAWSDLVQKNVHWRALVNPEMSLRVHKTGDILDHLS
jgi:hypothetical protein